MKILSLFAVAFVATSSAATVSDQIMTGIESQEGVLTAQEENSSIFGESSQMMNEPEIELAQTAASTIQNGGTYNAKLSLDKYTATLIGLFMVQLALCGLICYCTNQKVRDAELRNQQQKAEFYQFLYQFHK